jgi:hypothetical protein
LFAKYNWQNFYSFVRIVLQIRTNEKVKKPRIMEMTKFHQLCGAYDKAQTMFDNYQRECHLLSMEIVRELKSFFQIPESQFSLYKINDKGGFELVPAALIHAIRLAEDHYWHFGVGLTVCKAPETLPEELILIHLMFKRNDKEECFINYANGNEEFQIKKGDSASYAPFFEYLFTTVINSYESQLQQFIGEKTTRRLGYVKS